MEPAAAAVSSDESSEKECFVISPIGEPGSATRARADQVLEYVIQEALTPLGYKAIRADKISKPGLITIQILQKLESSALVVADLTERNANVFYELAALHSMARPAVIHIVEDSETTIPFDVNGLRLVKFNHKDLKSVADAKKEIQEHARQIEKGELGHNPITVAGMAHKLAISEGQNTLIAQALGQLLQGLSDLRAEIRVFQLPAAFQPSVHASIDYGTKVPLAALMAGGIYPTGAHDPEWGAGGTAASAKGTVHIPAGAKKKKDTEDKKD